MLSCRPLHVCKLGKSMYWNFELYYTVLPNTPIYTNTPICTLHGQYCVCKYNVKFCTGMHTPLL